MYTVTNKPIERKENICKQCTRGEKKSTCTRTITKMENRASNYTCRNNLLVFHTPLSIIILVKLEWSFIFHLWTHCWICKHLYKSSIGCWKYSIKEEIDPCNDPCNDPCFSQLVLLSRGNVVACSLELGRLAHAITHPLVSRALITAKWYVARISLSRDNVAACMWNMSQNQRFVTNALNQKNASECD